MKPARLIFSFFVLFIVCQSASAGQGIITLEEAQKKFRKTNWTAVDPVGVSPKMKGYKIRRYPGQNRVDLVSESNVYVIYEEFAASETGDSFDQKGSLGELLGVELPVFQYHDVVDLGMDSYIDLIGFAGGRMFKIHAWRNPEASQSERVIALDVAERVFEELGGS